MNHVIPRLFLLAALVGVTRGEARADAPREPASAQLPVLRTVPLDGNVLTGRAVASVVRTRRRAVARCFDRALERGARGGRVEFLVRVAPTGRVAKTQVLTKRFAGSDLAACIEKSIATWRFPAFSGRVDQEVVLPFRLQTPPGALARR